MVALPTTREGSTEAAERSHNVDVEQITINGADATLIHLVDYDSEDGELEVDLAFGVNDEVFVFGFSRGAFYSNFASKTALALAMIHYSNEARSVLLMLFFAALVFGVDGTDLLHEGLLGLLALLPGRRGGQPLVVALPPLDR